MRRISLLALAIVLTLYPAVANASETLTAAEAIERGLELDGVIVTIIGEAIGEDLRADAGHRWVNVRSGETVLGIYVTNADAARIERYGSYAETGDTVEVTGVLSAACQDHAGEFDVHADRVTIVAPGKTVEHRIEWWKGAVGVAALAIGLVEWRLFGRLREREER